MAKRHSLYSAKNGKGSVVFGPNVYDVQLLPYEKQLIETIGITEEEYKLFAAEVRRRGHTRPADYDHIPDIQAAIAAGAAAVSVAAVSAKSATTVVLTNLAISLTLTGIAYLLTPKPKMPGAQKQGGSISLDGITGASRFTPSQGFDSISELASYGSAIPIIFGLYKGGIGGMLVTPKLIWSRMFSYGTQQQAKLMFVVGEQGFGRLGIQPPELSGIFLGNNALDSLFGDFFAVYWKQATNGKGTIKVDNIIEGTQGTLGSGDPDAPKAGKRDAFLCPTEIGSREDQFCHAYSPSNNTSFGVYGSIPNGTSYRLNYNVISIPDQSTKRARRAATLKRIKIVGDQNFLRNAGLDLDSGKGNKALEDIRKQNQAGLGRNYSPRMGIVRVEKNDRLSTIIQTSDSSLTKIVNVRAGDKAIFLISNNKIDVDTYKRSGKGESVEDINTAVEAEQIAADEAMQLGEHFEIGGTIWKVTNRTSQIFTPEANQEIELTCVNVKDSLLSKIGIVNKDRVMNPVGGYIGDSPEDPEEGENQSVDETFYPLNRYSVASVRNNRKAIVTEIGIKSVVYQRIQGLCAFNSLPSPGEINEYDEDDLTVTTGQINSYVARTSCFQVLVRSDKNKNFKRLDYVFMVQGATPIAQYNSLRFINGGDIGPAELEFKLVPVSASVLRKFKGSFNTFVQLASKFSPDKTELLKLQVKNISGLGFITVECSGRVVDPDPFFQNSEFFRAAEDVPRVETLERPDSVNVSKQEPEKVSGTVIEKLTGKKLIANLDSRRGRMNAFTYAIAGSATNSKQTYFVGKTKEYPTGDSTQWVILKWVFERKEISQNNYARPGQTHTWKFKKVSVVGSSIGFTKNDKLSIRRGSQATNVLSGQSTYADQANPFAVGHPDGNLNWSGYQFKVSEAKTIDVPGRLEAYLYELMGDPAVLEIGTKKTAIINVVEGVKSIRLNLTSEVVEKRGQNVFDVDRKWRMPTVKVVGIGTNKKWEVNDKFSHKKILSAQNTFKTVYAESGLLFRVASRTKKVTESFSSSAARFEQKSQIADISLYRNLVEKSNQSGAEHEIVYINEIQNHQEEPTRKDLTLAGLSLRAGQNFSQLDQLRVWLKSGIPVVRLHPDKTKAYRSVDLHGPSNLFTDLVYHLLTDQVAGAGGLLGMSDSSPRLIDKEQMIETSLFIEKNKLFFNGPITDRNNLRGLITELAPYFLCNFIIADGKFSLKPALPYNPKSGAINEGPIPIEQFFTSGNILEDSFKVEYLSAEERRSFTASVRFREESQNAFPEEKVITVSNSGTEYDQKFVATKPVEQFDLTQFCTSESHAELVAKYFMVLRNLVTHTISFSTTLEGLDIKAGSFIKVITESSPYSSANNGTISASGVVTSARELRGGVDYLIEYFQTDSEDVEEGKLRIVNGKTSDPELFNSVFSVRDRSVSQNVYVIEQLTFSKEGIVDIVASEHPCDEEGRSRLVDSILNDSFDVS